MVRYEGIALGFAAIADGLAVVEAAGYVRLLYASRSDSRLLTLTLAEGVTPLAAPPGSPVIGRSPGADIVVQPTAAFGRLLVFSSHDGMLRHATLGSTGLPGFTNSSLSDQGFLNGITAMEIFDRGANDIAVIAQRNVPGLRIFSVSETGYFTLLSSLTDGPKTYLADVSDLAGLQIAGRSFLMVASALENGLSLFEIGEGGVASFVDALGAADGLPIAGPAALQSVVMGGVQFVVVASTLSSSLTVVRVNDMGVMFQTDHLIDDRLSRFADVAALDMFQWAGRVFVVAAGSDAGVSLIEMLPDGSLSHVLSHAMETGAGIGNVTGIETVVIGSSAAILLTDAVGTRITHLTINLAGIGGLIVASGGVANGSALEDRILGGAGAETLNGGAGDDFLHDGGGNDLLTGGAGADVFVFDRDGSADRIADFQSGVDRLDVSEWGRIYTAAALQITTTATGAVVSYGSESLTITRAGGGGLVLTDADFLF